MVFKKLAVLILLSLTLTSCALLEDRYRYECHDPENWYNKECNPPICEATGTCTKNILGFDPMEDRINE